MNGMDAIAEERWRQIFEEGWTAQHDDKHIMGEMAAVAACYAAPLRSQDAALQALWPASWSTSWWKPLAKPGDLPTRRRDLVRAGALIAAEIDRIDRALYRLTAESGAKSK